MFIIKYRQAWLILVQVYCVFVKVLYCNCLQCYWYVSVRVMCERGFYCAYFITVNQYMCVLRRGLNIAFCSAQNEICLNTGYWTCVLMVRRLYVINLWWNHRREQENATAVKKCRQYPWVLVASRWCSKKSVMIVQMSSESFYIYYLLNCVFSTRRVYVVDL